jgi:hypothetical protein
MTRTSTIILTIVLASPALAQPLPHPKTGQCSGGYVQSGSYCSPRARRPPSRKSASVPPDGGRKLRPARRCRRVDTETARWGVFNPGRLGESYRTR